LQADLVLLFQKTSSNSRQEKNKHRYKKHSLDNGHKLECQVLGMSLSSLVKEELSGSIAKSYVAQISNFHRVQASTMFHEAAEYVKSELLKIGLKEAVIEQFPADGAKKYWTHTSPMGWTECRASTYGT
jgi:hypothetical protein